MYGRATDAKGKRKVGEASKKPKRNVPRFNRGTISIPEDFIRTTPLKRARMGEEAPAEVGLQEPVVRDPSSRLPALPTIIEPLVAIHKREKTSSSGSVRVEEIIGSNDQSHHFRNPREIPNTHASGGVKAISGRIQRRGRFLT
ncbi:hypothetical protein ACOSQ3_014547 [Xanthoceras sorbifolium]